MALSYDERNAVAVLRKSMLHSSRGPEIVSALMKDMSKEIAVTALLGIRDSLNHMLVVNRAFQSAALDLSSKIDAPPTQGEPE